MSFSLTPGRNEDVLDLTNKIGIGNSKDISLFQSQLNRRPNTSGWNFKAGDILNIPDAKRVKRNLITHYGCLTVADIEASLTYIGQENRKAQNNQMMVECLLSSLTEPCFYKISNEEKKYTHANEPSAALLHKLLMQKAIIDTRATTYKFRSSLNNLPTYMGTINSDIELFNHHVKNAKEGLNSRGEVVNDLILKLFQGYKAAADTNFVAYIQKKEEDYMDEQDKDIEPEALMQLALNKFA